ncbi:MAG: polysaccharide pyruvyl transferase CsaB [Clostridia bacterium]|nr:polysaccharide pyruvyl transferase CsaB [Clostridia bacterium]
MKIIMTLMSLNIGGAETHVVELSKQLVKAGHQVTIVADSGAYSEMAEKAGIKLVNAPLDRRDFKSMYQAYKILKHVISTQKPDIVHAHARIPGFLCHLVRHTVKFKFVTSVHGTYSTAFPLKLFTRWGSKSLAVSEDIKRYLIDNYKVKSKNIIVSVNGVDTERFSPDSAYESILPQFGFDKSAKRIVYMSRLNEDVCKPLFKVLEFFEDLEKEHPGLELLVIGHGNCYDKIESRANAINIRLSRTAVALTGAVTDVPRYLASADIGFGVGRAVLECMAMGKPVIVAGEEGYIGIFDHDTLGEAVETNFTCRHRMDIQDEKFKQDMLTLLDMTNEQRLILGSYGRNIVKERYSLDTMLKDNLALYDMVAGSNKKYDCTILGYYGFKNNGDDALLAAMVDSLREINPDIKINVLSYKPAETAAQYGVDSISRYNIFKIRRTIKNSELFILGGGSLIQDVTSTKSIIYYLMMINVALSVKTAVMMYANGIGPITKKINRHRAKRVLNKVNYITLRDEKSLVELKSLGVNKPETLVTADPVFASESKNPQGADLMLENAGLAKDEKFAVFAVRKWKNLSVDFDEKFAKMADYIAEKHGLVPVFIPLHYPYDASVSRNIISKMKNRALFISGKVDLSTMLSLVEKSSLNVSVRLHSLIYSACAGVPSIGIAYDPKIPGFQQSVNQPYINPSDFKPEVYRPLIDKCIENHEEISKTILESTSLLKAKAKLNATVADELMR